MPFSEKGQDVHTAYCNPDFPFHQPPALGRGSVTGVPPPWPQANARFHPSLLALGLAPQPLALRSRQVLPEAALPLNCLLL